MSATTLLGTVIELWKDARAKGFNEEAVGRAAAYTERRIREGSIFTHGEARICFAAFADGWHTGKGHCGQAVQP